MATDNFTGTDDTNLSDYSANWSALASAELNQMHIKSNAVENAANSGNRYSGRTWADDQYSQAVVVATPSLPDANWGVCVRCGTGTSQDFYAGGIDPGQLGHSRYAIWKRVAGVRTLLTAHGSQTMAYQDVVKLQVVGTSLELFVNGSSILTTTDSSHSSGQAGIIGFNFSSPMVLIDDWEGDDLSVAAATPSVNDSVTAAEAVTMHMPISLKMMKL